MTSNHHHTPHQNNNSSSNHSSGNNNNHKNLHNYSAKNRRNSQHQSPAQITLKSWLSYRHTKQAQLERELFVKIGDEAVSDEEIIRYINDNTRLYAANIINTPNIPNEPSGGNGGGSNNSICNGSGSGNGAGFRPFRPCVKIRTYWRAHTDKLNSISSSALLRNVDVSYIGAMNYFIWSIANLRSAQLLSFIVHYFNYDMSHQDFVFKNSSLDEKFHQTPCAVLMDTYVEYTPQEQRRVLEIIEYLGAAGYSFDKTTPTNIRTFKNEVDWQLQHDYRVSQFALQVIEMMNIVADKHHIVNSMDEYETRLRMESGGEHNNANHNNNNNNYHSHQIPQNKAKSLKLSDNPNKI